MSDPGLTYRTRDEVQEVRRTKDPIEFVKKTLLEHTLATEAEIKEFDKIIKADVDAAVEISRASPYPDVKDLYDNVYIDQHQHYIRGVEIQDSIKPGNQKGSYWSYNIIIKSNLLNIIDQLYYLQNCLHFQTLYLFYYQITYSVQTLFITKT